MNRMQFQIRNEYFVPIFFVEYHSIRYIELENIHSETKTKTEKTNFYCKTSFAFSTKYYISNNNKFTDKLRNKIKIKLSTAMELH